MKNKIIGILICTLLIATSTVVTVRSLENEKITSTKLEDADIHQIDFFEKLELSKNNSVTLDNGFEQCIAACLGITLAGNCLYFVVGCALSPGPHNFCCWAVPIFCGVDIGLLISCIAGCAEQFGNLVDEPDCFPPYVIKFIELFQNKNSSAPAIILGLICLYQRWQKVKEWLKEHGYLSINLPEIQDCGCNNEP